VELGAATLRQSGAREVPPAWVELGAAIVRQSGAREVYKFDMVFAWYLSIRI
jgi:hypothetical protein